MVFAYQNYCVHAGHPLNWKPDSFLTPDQTAIICASHGATFAIDSGECFAGPCVGKALHAVDARVENGEVMVTGPESA